MLRNLVIGAGSMGLMLQYLIQESEESHMLARDVSCAALLDKALEVSGAVAGKLKIHCHSWSDFPQLSYDSAIFIATKALEIPVVLQNLAPHIKTSNKIVLMQNGLGIYEMAKEILPDNPIFRLLCYIGVRKVSACHIHVAGIHKYEFAGDKNHASFLKYWQQALLDKGVDTTVNFNPLESEWQKALWNLSINGLCSIVDEPNGAIADSPELNNLARQVVLEAVEIAQLEGIHLTTEHVEDVFKSLARTRENINATLQDLRAGRHPELEFLNGAVAKIAAKHARRAPLNEAIFNLVTFLEKAEKRKEIEDGRSGTQG